MHHRLFAAFALIAGTAATPALAQQNQDINGWTLNDDGGSCAISQFTENPPGLSMVNDGQPAADAIGIVNAGITGVTRGMPAKLRVTYAGQTRDFDASGLQLDSGWGGFMVHGFPIDIFATQDVGDVLFYWNGKLIHTMKTDGIRPAAQAMRECGRKY